MNRAKLQATVAISIAGSCIAGKSATADAPSEEADSAGANDVVLTADDLRVRPHDGSTDLLRDLYGMSLIQTAGGAVADQFTLRGFDGRSATDVSVVVDGVPINLPSHPSNDGFADTHFLIAPMVTSVALHKGPQPARSFGSVNAGELELRTIDHVPGGGVVVAVRSGTLASDLSQIKQRVFRLMHRAIAITSPKLASGEAIVAAEVSIADGFTANPQRFRRTALMAKWRHPTSSGELRFAANLYAGRWAESGFVPVADIAAGTLGRFDSIDPSQGGTATRASISAIFETPKQLAEFWRIGAFAVRSDWQRFENQSLFLRNIAQGDQTQVIDSRQSLGMYATYRRSLRSRWWKASQVIFGVDFRSDDGTIERWRTTRQRKSSDCFAELNPCQLTDPTVVATAMYAQQRIDVTRSLRVTIGLRADQYIWNIDDRDPDSATTSGAGGSASRARVSPSLGLRFLRGATTWTFNGQLGARSTDAHAAVLSDSYATVVRATTADAGVHVRPSAQLEAVSSVWYSSVEQQQIWDSPMQRVVLQPGSARMGADVWARLQPSVLAGLKFDAALSVVPAVNAHTPRFLASSGIAFVQSRTTAALRIRGVGMHGGSGFSLLSAVVGHRWSRIALELTAQNILNQAWNEAEITQSYRSTRAGKSETGQMITPGSPRSLMLSVDARL
jgi:TonB-dependent Receptor Plug Domain/TonB dependent receptor